MSGNRTLSPELLRQLRPYVLGWVTERISGGSTPSGSVEHNSLTLSSYLDDILSVDTYQVLDLATEIANTVLAGPTSGAAARPTFRALVNADLPSAIVSNSHARSHSITGASDHTVTGSANQIVGLTGTNTLGILSPLSTVGAGTIPIGGTAGAITWSGTQTFSTAATFSQGLAVTGAYAVTLGGDVAISRTAANVLGLGSGDSMQSTTYTSGAAGWKIGADGSAEFQNIKARGELHATVFVQDMIEAHAGTLMVPKSAATLYSAMTVPANVTTERVTNGTFTTDTTGWTASWQATLSSEAGGQDGNCLKVLNGAAGWAKAIQAITTVAGRSYTLGFWAKAGTGNCLISVGTTSGGWDLGTSGCTSGTWTWGTLTFTAAGTTTYVNFGVNSATNGLYCYYDGITCSCWTMTLENPSCGGFLFDNGDICRCKTGSFLTPGNMVLNPSFEGGDSNSDGVGDHWSQFYSNAELAGQYTFSLSTTQAAVGATSQKLVVNTLTGITSDRYIALYAGGATDGPHVHEGETWSMSAQVYIESYSGTPWIQLILIGSNDAGAWIGNGTIADATLTTGSWQTLTVNGYTIGAGVTCLTPRFQIGTLGNGDAITAYFDKVKILREATAGTYVDGDQADGSWSGTEHASTSYYGVTGDVWFKVGNRVDNGNGTQSYTCTYLSGNVASARTYPVKSVVLDYGATTGGGMVSLSADGAIGSGANLSILTHAGAPYTTTTVKARLGNLNGSYGQVADVYGFGVGDYSGGNYLLYDGTAFSVNAGGGKVVIDNAGGISLVEGTGVVNALTWYRALGGTATAEVKVKLDSTYPGVFMEVGATKLAADTYATTRIFAQGTGANMADITLRGTGSASSIGMTVAGIACVSFGENALFQFATTSFDGPEAGCGNVYIGGKFGCNGTTPQAKYALDAAVSGTVDNTYGADEHAVLDKLVSQVNKIRAALVANGICS